MLLTLARIQQNLERRQRSQVPRPLPLLCVRASTLDLSAQCLIISLTLF